MADGMARCFKNVSANLIQWLLLFSGPLTFITASLIPPHITTTWICYDFSLPPPRPHLSIQTNEKIVRIDPQSFVAFAKPQMV